MAQTISLAASPRQATGKGGARQARFRGKVPAVIYGHGRDTQSLELEAKALEKALTGVEPASTIVELAVEGKAAVKTLIREIQRHPLRPDIIHVDFYEIHATEKVKLKVPVHLVGNPDGVDLVKIHVDDVGPQGVPLDLADQRLHRRLALHRQLDDGARGLDSGEGFLERFGLELERLGIASVPVDHRGDLAAEAGLAGATLAGRLPGARRERDDLGHGVSYPLYVAGCTISRTASSPIDCCAHTRWPWLSGPRSTAPSVSRSGALRGSESCSPRRPHRYTTRAAAPLPDPTAGRGSRTRRSCARPAAAAPPPPR